jgi:hypothetical protein
VTSVIPAPIASTERFVSVSSGRLRSCAIALDGAAVRHARADVEELQRGRHWSRRVHARHALHPGLKRNALSPAVECPRIGDRTGVPQPRTHSEEAHRAGRRARHCLAGTPASSTPSARDADTKLPSGVATPAIQRARGADATRVRSADGHRPPSRRGDRRRDRTVCVCESGRSGDALAAGARG